MNLKELKKKLGDNFESFVKQITEYYPGNEVNIVHDVEFTVEELERKNEYMIHVIKVGNNYFRLMGSYDSWAGTDYSYCDLEEVRPVQVTVTEWERVGKNKD